MPYPRSVILPLILGALLAGAQPSAVGGAPARDAEAQGRRSIETLGERVQFDYRVRRADGDMRTVSFALPAEAYAEARQGLTPLQSDAVKGRLDRQVRRYAEDSRQTWRAGIRARLEALQGTLPDGIEMTYTLDEQRLSWSLKGQGVTQAQVERTGRRLKQQIRRASARLKQQQRRDLRAYAEGVRDELLAKLNYVRDPNLGNLIRPDYAALARGQAGLLQPMARAIARAAGSRDPRRRIDLALALMQQIPYDELRVRGATDGTGFAVPAELLHVNRGDCDSKATALAALMRTLSPEIATAIVLLPGHAVLAADLPVRPGDRTLELDGRTFVLMEPAGPLRLPVGRIAQGSHDLLRKQGVASLVWITGGPQDA
ncbi:hypothetical protein [Rhodovibrio salinarum]|uniref:Uncharacterized protein n=1 Tax=Rhodovibrio salinarum TaxID=1087 RepID=A0A934QG11_9PROT|nr:hypothetical protein [Rhodovibrio salinarum]MBK1696099.1 hypothetical protein [Rhodovibrio salinarum]